MVHIILKCMGGYVNGPISGIAFFNFSSVVVRCRCVLPLVFDWKRMSLNILRPLNHPRNISAVKAEMEP